MSNELIKLDNVSDLEKFCERIAKSGLAPKAFDSAEKVFVALCFGRELGFSPMQSLQSLMVIGGKVGILGDGAKALCEGAREVNSDGKSVPVCEYIKDELVGQPHTEDRGVRVTVKRYNKPELVRDFTMRDARRAGLSNRQGPWTQYPERMCYYRALGFALRDAFPDILRGIKTTEELADYPGVEPERTEPAKSTRLDQYVKKQLDSEKQEVYSPAEIKELEDQIAQDARNAQDDAAFASQIAGEELADFDEFGEQTPSVEPFEEETPPPAPVRKTRSRSRKKTPPSEPELIQEQEPSPIKFPEPPTREDKVAALRRKLTDSGKTEESLLAMIRLYEGDYKKIEDLSEELIDRVEGHWAGIVNRL